MNLYEESYVAPDVVNVQPLKNYKVKVTFEDGKTVLFDAKPLLEKGIFHILKKKKFFFERCTVINHTLAWDRTGTKDPYQCLDIAPEVLYELEDMSLSEMFY